MRLRPRYLALIATAALVLVLGFGVGLLIRPSPSPQGKLLVLLTVDLPLPQNPATLHDRAIGLRLLPEAAGSSWESVTVPAADVTLPGSWEAPNTDSLFLATVPAGDYRSAELVLRSDLGGLVDDSQKLALKVAKSGLTPLLFTFRASSAVAGAGLADAAAYGGNDQVNFGLQVAQGQVLSVPTVPLLDQSGRSVSLRQYQGKVLVLASFLSQCQDTCPLVTAGLLQLQTLLDQKDLQSQVQIVEVSQDPADDTPAILAKYRSHFALPWPLLTGTAANLDQFWSQLKVPPIQDESWNGPAPTDIFTGQPEPFDIVHSSVVDVINPKGYVVSELEGQPSLSAATRSRDGRELPRRCWAEGPEGWGLLDPSIATGGADTAAAAAGRLHHAAGSGQRRRPGPRLLTTQLRRRQRGLESALGARGADRLLGHLVHQLPG